MLRHIVLLCPPPVQELCDTLMEYLTTEAQVKLYRSTVITLLHFSTPSLKTSETAKVGALDALRTFSKGSVVQRLFLWHDKLHILFFHKNESDALLA